MDWRAPLLVAAVVAALALPVWLVVTVGRMLRLGRLEREIASASAPTTYSEAVAVDPRSGWRQHLGRAIWTARTWETGRLVLDADLHLRFDGPRSGFDVSVADVVDVAEVGGQGMRLRLRDGRSVCFDVSPHALRPITSSPGIDMEAVAANRIRYGWMLAIGVAQRFAGG